MGKILTVIVVTTLLVSASISPAVAQHDTRLARSSGMVIDLQPDIDNATDGARYFVKARTGRKQRGSRIQLGVGGLDAPDGAFFAAHVHVGDCSSPGGHWNAGGPVNDEYELWAPLSVRHGRARVVSSIVHVIPPGESGSLVIHSGPAGSPGGCIPLDW